jgi:hypothetical protein
MVSVIAGILLVVLGVVLWLGAISTGHAFAVLLVVLGILLALYYAYPAGYARRVR